MQGPIAEQLARIAAEAATADMMVRQHDYAGARETVRLIMGHAQRLYGRLTFLDEQRRDADFIAEVDRAVRRSDQGPVVGPIKGDQPLPLSPDPGKGGRSTPPRTRKGKG